MLSVLGGGKNSLLPRFSLSDLLTSSSFHLVFGLYTPKENTEVDSLEIKKKKKKKQDGKQDLPLRS